MKKWLPYIVASVLGLAAAGLMFIPETATKPAEVSVATTGAEKSKMFRKSSPEGFKMWEGKEGDDPNVSPPPRPPGTPNELSPGQIAQAERRARPFNQHYTAVAPLWNQIAPMIGPTDMSVAKQCSEMELFLLDQSKLSSEDMDVAGSLEKELQLEKKIRTLAIQNPELTAVLDYINNSANTVIQGGDPTTIPKPGKG